jgi:hypothetical protein
MMSALISFVRELALELNRGADALEAEAEGLKTTDVAEERAIVTALLSAATMRHVGKAIERAAKKALCT